jgi:glycine cleavage system pyridoxal-binding protein P
MSVFVPNGNKERERMLEAIGVKDFEDLLSPIPESVRMKGALQLPPRRPSWNCGGSSTDLRKRTPPRA